MTGHPTNVCKKGETALCKSHSFICRARALNAESNINPLLGTQVLVQAVTSRRNTFFCGSNQKDQEDHESQEDQENQEGNQSPPVKGCAPYILLYPVTWLKRTASTHHLFSHSSEKDVKGSSRHISPKFLLLKKRSGESCTCKSP